MTAPTLTPRQEAQARVLAREIGAAFRREREARGDRLKDIGQYIGTPSSDGNVSMFERGKTSNLMLGTAVRYLSIYGLTLTVVSKKVAWPTPDLLGTWIEVLTDHVRNMSEALLFVQSAEVRLAIESRAAQVVEMVRWLESLRLGRDV